MRISPSHIVVVINNSAPPTSDGTGVAEGTFPHLRSSPRRVLLPHCGLADAISPDQIFANADAAGLLRSDGNSAGTAEKHPSFDRTRPIKVGFSFFSNEFAATWTIFPDTRPARFRSSCAISANVWHRMSS